MEAANNNIPPDAGEGLDELLDSCLGDFDKPVPKPTTVVSSVSDAPGGSNAQEKAPNIEVKIPDLANWSEEFTQFQDVMENFLGNESDLSEIKNLLGDLNMGAESNEAFEESFLKTIKDLTEGAQNVPQMSPDELAGLFNNFDMNDSASADPDQIPEIMPLMHNVMQRLMSKELLYPSLKEIVDKYPNWLSEKQLMLKAEEYKKYDEQYQLMRVVCDEFESQSDCDSDDAKKDRFERILKLMTKIQYCGNPPKDLVSDIGGQNVPLDEHGNLHIPGMPQQCVMM